MGFLSQLFGNRGSDSDEPKTSQLSNDITQAIESCNIAHFTQAFLDFEAMGQAEARAAGKEFFVKKEFAAGWDQFKTNPSRERLKQWFRLAPNTELMLLELIRLSKENYGDSTQSKKNHQTVHTLLSLTKEPSMPASFTGSLHQQNRGQIWVAEDFFVVFEARPLTIKQAQALIEGAIEVPRSFILHEYSASAFYRLSRNPHGPSKRPIFVVSIEKSPLSSDSFLNAYMADGRHNLGVIKQFSDEQEVCKLLLDGIKHQLKIQEEFVFVGTSDEQWDSPAVN